MWGTDTLQSHPSDTRGMSRSVTGTGLLGPLMLQIETFGRRFTGSRPPICNSYELKQLLNVTDRDKTSQHPYH